MRAGYEILSISLSIYAATPYLREEACHLNFILSSFPSHSIAAAPEIIEEAQAYPQSDMWSLGVLLYVMLSGQLPFKGESAEETRDNIVNVRFKFEWLYKEVTMEATRLLMWIFKRAPW